MTASMLSEVVCRDGGQVALDGVEVGDRVVEPVVAFLVDVAAVTEAQHQQKRKSSLSRGQTTMHQHTTRRYTVSDKVKWTTPSFCAPDNRPFNTATCRESEGYHDVHRGGCTGPHAKRDRGGCQGPLPLSS